LISLSNAAGVGTPDDLGVAPDRCAAIEDSEDGIRSEKAPGMRVIPNRHFPPSGEMLAAADIVLYSLDDLSVSVVSTR
jgi:beta-phosphoglucomutase-like phosphatase (HAD superfamily)